MSVRCVYCGDRFSEEYYNDQHVPCPSGLSDSAHAPAEVEVRTESLHYLYALKTNTPIALWVRDEEYWVDIDTGDRLYQFDHIKPKESNDVV